MRPKSIKTEEHEKIIKDNYLKLSDKELSELIKAPIVSIQKFRSDHNLYKNKKNSKVGTDINGEEIFVVGNRNWLF